MFLIRTIVAPSAIHGVGVFAAEDVAAGRVIWEYADGIDLAIPLARVAEFPDAFRAYLETYAYIPKDMPGRYVLSCDHAKFLNHSEDPNTALEPFRTLSRRAIARGEEITCDYRAFVAGWTGFDPPKV